MFKKKAAENTRPDTNVATMAARGQQRRTPPMPDPGGSAGRLTVGPDIRLKSAAIEDCDTLFVEGRVEASMDSRALQIEKSGVFVGAATIDEAEIHGRFEGDLTACDRLVIHKTGYVAGTIRYGRLSIEEGGELAGDIAAADSKAPAIKSKLAAVETTLAEQPQKKSAG
jgi:cytoskeletal protein CcmA (bactofilin family)